MSYDFIRTTGVIVSDTQDVLKTVQDEWKQIFGNALSLDASTPQGRIMEMTALERKNIMNVLAFMCNQLNPSYSTGVYLDAIAGFFGLDREAGTHTTLLYVTLTGVPNSLIPATSRAETTDGDIFILSENVTLGADGKGLGTFVALEAGPIPCPAGALNKISVPVAGWETVYNGSNGVLGALEESDAALRTRLDMSKFKWSTNMVRSLSAAIYEVEGIQDVYIYENFNGIDYTSSNNPLIPAGETVKAHSVMIVVLGGSADGEFLNNVAKAILEKRSGGCGMSAVANEAYVRNIGVQNGATNREYIMTFNEAQSVPIYISLSVENISYSGANLAEAIKEVLLNWFSGNIEGIEAPRIGQKISIFDITSVVSKQIGVYIKSCTIGKSSSSMGVNEIPIDFTDVATLDYNNITVSVL